MAHYKIARIIGKTIESIVVSDSNQTGPSEQIFFIFNDGTYYEMYGPSLGCTGGPDRGGVDAVIEYAKKFGGKITTYSPDSNI